MSVEPLEMQGQQVSDGRRWGGVSVLLCAPEVANAYPSNNTLPIMSEMALLGIGESLYARRVHHWA